MAEEGLPPSTNHGRLMIIGGHEDRKHGKEILRRFVELAGGAERKIVVLTAASKVPQAVWEMYDRAFGELGVRHRSPIDSTSRTDANDSRLAEEVASADGIFMAGGDQKRLLAMIGGTPLHDAMRRAFTERGACIGGTSAGASAMSAHMLADGKTESRPEKGTVHLAAGLGFVRRAVIDQHFSERRRLARLLTVVAHNPHLLGIGVDEDTALVIGRGAGIEVIGEGAITLIDGRHMISNFLDIDAHDSIELINVKLHMLPSGARYRPGDIPEPLQDFLNILTRPESMP